MSNTTVKLPNGQDFLTSMEVTGGEAAGLTILVVTSSISAFAVVSLLIAIAVSAWNTRKSVNPHMFVRSHAAAYLISLLLCDLIQAIGSLMNARWVAEKAVTFEPFCQTQGVIKQIADVGTAIWALVIATHTFWVLFLKWHLRRYVLIATMVFNWAAIGTFVIAGAATVNVKQNGPFYGISGYWCWISEGYPVARIVLDYLFMFVSAFLSFVLYTLIFLKIRGNILVAGRRTKFRIHHKTDSARGLSADPQTIAVAKQMLLYPVAYTIIILPIAICRFAEWSGADVPFAATIFTDTLYLLSGLVNVSLFFLTRRVLPRHSIITKRFTDDKEEEEDDFESAGPETAPARDIPNVNEAETHDSYMAEKMSEAYGDEKMFKRVDSPDSDLDSDDGSSETDIPPPIAIMSPDTNSATSTEMFSRISLDSPYSSKRAQFPASAGGPMTYPQSPLSAGGRGSKGPVSPPLRSAALRSNLGLQ